MAKIKKERTEKVRHLSKRGIPEGTPRTVSPDDKTLIEWGKEMCTWLDLNPKACSVEQWAIGHKGILSKEWDCIKQRSTFIPYYEVAKQKIIQRMSDGTFHNSIGHRYLSMYNKTLYQSDMQKIQDEAYNDALGKIKAHNEQGSTLTLEDLVKSFEQ